MDQAIDSVLSQATDGVELEYIIIDGGSTDGSLEIIQGYECDELHLVSERDSGPANALNKGLRKATGEVIGWLNADDMYLPNTLARVKYFLENCPEVPSVFGRCLIIDDKSNEIRGWITRFKEMFFPISSRFAFRCINYVSQPTVFMRSAAVRNAGLLSETMVAAWDYQYFLKLWRQGEMGTIPGPPLACFRWHEGSISGQNISTQFREEYEAAKNDAGRLHPAVTIHMFVRWMIVGIYKVMAWGRRLRADCKRVA